MESPADLSQIANVLGHAKKIMNKSEGTTGTKPNSFNPSINEGQEKQMPGMTYESKTKAKPAKLNPDAIRNSKLPAAIRESLLDDPNDYDLNDAADDKLNSVLETINGAGGSQPQQINETVEPTRSMISETQIRGIVKEELMEFFSKEMVKMVAEQIIGKLKKKK